MVYAIYSYKRKVCWISYKKTYVYEFDLFIGCFI